MIDNMTVIERFLKYVTFDTQSDESTGVTPSTAKQMVFAQYLRSELEQLGFQEISLDENETDFTYDAATATLTWKGSPEGTVYTHDVNLNITYTHNWGVVTKTFKVTVTRKVQ